MPQITMYQQADVPAHITWQAVSFMRTEWPSIFSGSLRWLSNTYPPDMNPIHFVLHQGDVLISYAAAMQLSLVHQGATYRTFGVGNVFTFPPYRREGHGQELMRAVADYLDASDLDLAMLFCNPALATWYAKTGWQRAEGAETRIGTPDSSTLDHDTRMTRYMSSHGKQARDALLAFPLFVEWAW